MLKFQTLGTIDLRTPDAAVLSVLHRQKHIALLAYLALARPAGHHRRDVLVALLWPELDAERARAALRKVLHGLRQGLGPDALLRRGDEEIALAPGHVWCDAVALEECAAAGDAAGALAHYGGPLLPGLHVAGAPEFEEWLERERERLRRLARDTAWRAAEDAERDGRAVEALGYGRRALELAGCDDVAMRRLLALHERLGDPAGGIAAFEVYRARLRAEFDVGPGAETAQAAEALRVRLAAAAPAPPPPSPRPPEPNASPVTPAMPAAPRRDRIRQRGWHALTVALVLVLAVLAGTWLRASRGSATVPPILAVGAVHDFTGDSASAAAALPDLLATNLARAPGLQVVSTARMYELLGGTALERNAAGAARRAGATELIEGALHRVSADTLRLDVRRVDLRTGAVKSAVSVAGVALFDVVDRATMRLTEAFGTPEPHLRVADVTTTSPEAYGYYQHGLRAYYARANGPLAHGFFRAALESDSAFAMAAFYAALSAPDHAQRRALLAQALRLSVFVTERERLLIAAQWADEMNEPARLAIAESLAVRFPTDPDGHYLRGRALVWNGDFLAAVPHLRRVLAMDSAAPAATPRCRACDALAALTLAYMLADSMPAAQATAEQWLRWRPESANAWDALANALEAAGRSADALTARKRQDVLAPRGDYPAVYPAVLAIRAGDFANADGLLAMYIRHGAPNVAQLAAWYEVISLRYQGRLQEALQLVRRMEGAGGKPGELEALVLQEGGRGREAAAIFGARAADLAATAASGDAWASRDLVFNLTRQADALAESGDTAALRDLAARIREAAPASGYGRDHRLHHHVLGRRHAARGEHERAVEEFRQALFSTTAGYTRTNAELARSLLALGRPGEAITVLQPAFRNAGLQASTLYVTHAELHELLGHAFAAAGHPDSARVHLRWTADAWRRADPLLHPRRDALERRLRALQ